MRNQLINRVNLSATIGLTIVALLNKEITVFYMLYLFWWQALIEVVATIIVKTRLLKSLYKTVINSAPGIFMMGLYWVFILLIFGIVLSFSHKEIFDLNFDVFLFRNIPFNATVLLSILFTFIKYYNGNSENHDTKFGVFSNKMLILHFSIILGGMIHFGLLEFYPESFEGSMTPFIVSAVPFLLLRSLLEWKNDS